MALHLISNGFEGREDLVNRLVLRVWGSSLRGAGRLLRERDRRLFAGGPRKKVQASPPGLSLFGQAQ